MRYPNRSIPNTLYLLSIPYILFNFFSPSILLLHSEIVLCNLYYFFYNEKKKTAKSKPIFFVSILLHRNWFIPERNQFDASRLNIYFNAFCRIKWSKCISVTFVCIIYPLKWYFQCITFENLIWIAERRSAAFPHQRIWKWNILIFDIWSVINCIKVYCTYNTFSIRYKRPVYTFARIHSYPQYINTLKTYFPGFVFLILFLNTWTNRGNFNFIANFACLFVSDILVYILISQRLFRVY